MAPESLSQNIYDTRSDTYAFGILLWQIIHFGKKYLNLYLLYELILYSYAFHVSIHVLMSF